MFWLIVLAVLTASALSLFFSTLTYSLRDFTRSRLEEALEQRGKSRWFEPTIENAAELVFVTAIGRLICNLLILISVMHLFHGSALAAGWQYLFAVLITLVISLFCSVAFPHAIAAHAGERCIAAYVGFIHGWKRLLSPATGLMRGIDRLVAKAADPGRTTDVDERREQDFRQEIVSAVEDGEADGVVDEEQKEMIRSVIEFQDTTAGEIMTPRPQIIAIPAGSTLDEIKQVLSDSGHSRVPIYEGSLDHVVGLLYARDLLQHVGRPAGEFDVKQAVRPPFYVPKSKSLRDLLDDFRLQKIHIAIVLDEYGGTAGLVTIEDVLEELVGEISDEHEPSEPAMLKRISESVAEADARIRIDELNQLLNLTLPEEEGYETLGGFLSGAMGRIPPAGAVYTHPLARFTILEAEPQRVDRVRIEVLTPVMEYRSA